MSHTIRPVEPPYHRRECDHCKCRNRATHRSSRPFGDGYSTIEFWCPDHADIFIERHSLKPAELVKA